MENGKPSQSQAEMGCYWWFTTYCYGVGAVGLRQWHGMSNGTLPPGGRGKAVEL